MVLLTKLAEIEGGILLCGLFGIVVFKLVTGEISLEGLLRTKHGADDSYSPARLQLLIFTVVVAATYLHKVILSPQTDSLPDLPQNVVAALGGSHVTYLGGKALSTFIQPRSKTSR